MNNKEIRSIIISRTDAIGDVVLTLPLASVIKQCMGEDVRIIFFGKTYTYPLINSCTSVDQFINYDTFKTFDENGQIEFLKQCNADAIIHVFPRSDIASAAKGAKIKNRIGTTNRLYHWLTCNKLIRLSRRHSDLHESQLNLKLLKGVGIEKNLIPDEIYYYYNLKRLPELPDTIASLLSKEKFKLVIHPKSHSSGRDWKLENYKDLIRFLPPDKFQFIITGSEKEMEIINEWYKTLPSYVVNLAGKLSLEDLIALLNKANGIVAASTGPLHIAAALGKYTLGIYPPLKPIDPVRWAPVGKHAQFLVSPKNCSDCRNTTIDCHCMNDITADDVHSVINNWIK